MKIINPRLHSIIDYLVVLFLWISPSAFQLPESTTYFTYVLGGVHLLLTIGTKYPGGIIKVIPLAVHGWVEFIVSILLFGVGVYFGNTEGELSRNFYFAFAGAVFATWFLTRYRENKIMTPKS
ncbi:MAG: hypothetical protein ACPF8V_00490 [Luteibaculum sp.]